jgi:hypothetical protein
LLPQLQNVAAVENAPPTADPDSALPGALQTGVNRFAQTQRH